MDFPLYRGSGRLETAGIVNSGGTTITAAGSSNTKGSYAEILASSAFHSGLLFLEVMGASGSGDFLVDIAIGAGGSEQIIIPNLIYSANSNDTRQHRNYSFPISIPAGTRISARSQCTTVSRTVKVAVKLFAQTFLPALSRVSTYGAATGDSGGVALTSGGSNNTKGSYAEISASIGAPIRELTIALGNQLSAARGSHDFLIDLAIGAGGSEQIVVPNLLAIANGTTGGLASGVIGPFPIPIPAGSRLSARLQCSTASQSIDVVVYGVD